MLTGKPKSNFDMVIPWESNLCITKCIFLLINRRKVEVVIMHYIYCFKNKINGHKYVGQTNNLGVRYSAHKSQAFNPNSKDYNCLFHQKIREYGLENFEFYVLEEIDSNDSDFIDYREQFWIQEENSWCRGGQGYNQTSGGTQYKKSLSISDETIVAIKHLLKTTDISFNEIATRFNTYRECIARINTGKYAFDVNEAYPLRMTREWHQIQNDVKIDIANALLNTKMTQKDIAKKYQVSVHLVANINQGNSNLQGDYVYPLRPLRADATRANKYVKKANSKT